MKILNYKITFLLLIICTKDSQQMGEQKCLPAALFLHDALKKYNIVGLDEGPHATLQGHKFLRSLISGPKVSNSIDYIILELANVTQQATLDKYISGQNVKLSDLKAIWRVGTQAHNSTYGEAPVYLKFLQLIRNLNSKNAHKIRLIAGDPAIKWNEINNINQYFSNISQRDVLPAKEAIRYGIDSNKKVLLIYGGEHHE